MNQENVLILRSAIGFFGAESVILEIAKGLATSHYKPIIGVFQNSHNPHLELVTCAQQNNIETAIFSCSHQFDFRTIRALCNFVKNKQISILNSHGYKANFYALMVKKFVQIPLVATCHPWLESSIRTKFYAWLDKNLLKKFDQITAISNIEKNEIRQRVAAHKISVINNGVDISRFAKIYNIKKIKAELGIKSDGKVVGTVGRLSPEKGHENLFKAIIRIAPNNGDLTLVVVGDGPLKKKLQAQANKFKIVDHIIFTGISNEIPSLMSIFDVFVLPSQTEGLPMALLEAMAAKKPVVATDVGDVSSVIQNQVSGLLIPPNNSEKMAEAINRLLSDKKLADNLAQKGFEMAKKKYSSSNMAEQYVNVFDRVRPT